VPQPASARDGDLPGRIRRGSITDPHPTPPWKVGRPGEARVNSYEEGRQTHPLVLR